MDTSVHVSAEVYAKPGSPSLETLRRGFDGQYVLAVSDQLLEEIAYKLVEKRLSPDRVADYVSAIMAIAEHFPDAAIGSVTCSDPDDIFVRVLAGTAAAWCVVSQDNALVDHHAAPPGWPPPVFLARLRVSRGESEDARYP